MLKHYLKISIRSIWKDKGYSFINILGLAVAVACCLLLIFWIKHELSYENCYINADRIYRVIEVEERETGKYHSAYIRPGISEDLKKQFPQIEASVFVRPGETLPFKVVGEDMKDGVVAAMATSSIDYLRMFDLKYVEGSPQTVAKNNGTIMTEECARKFFGDKSAIGETLTFGSVVNLTIDAVVQMPENTHINFDILNLPKREGHNYGVHYIMLKKGTKLTPQFRKDVSLFLASSRDTENKLTLQPIKEMHLSSPKEIRTGNPDQLVLFSIAAFLILVVAVVSYINSSIARALNRMKEVGVRKVTGGKKKQLIQRFLCEYFIVSLLAVLLGMTFVEILFPYFTQIMGNKLYLTFDGLTIFIVLGVCVLITLLSGGYSAFYLSSLNPIMAFRGGSQTGSKEGLRKILLGVQFFLSVGILTCTTFIYKQLNMMVNADIGVKKENVLVLKTNLWYNAQTFFDVIKQENPDIIDATITNAPPYNAQWGYSGVSWEGSKDDVKNMEFSQIFCDHNYANVFGLEIVQGEFIPPGLTWWQHSKSESFNIVINESFKKLMGEDNPIGITVHYGWGMSGKITGVVKDFNFKPLKEKISPLILSFNPEACVKVYIKTTGKNKQAVVDYIAKKYDEMKGDTMPPAEYHWVEDDFNEMYKSEIQTVKILSIFTLISLALSLMGIFSMIAFMIEKRTKELAIRKINGAKIPDIMRLFIKDILKVALAASVIAIPICYIILNRWLQSYAYKTALSWWVFLLVVAVVVAISALLVAIQVYITGRQNPVESLRSE